MFSTGFATAAAILSAASFASSASAASYLTYTSSVALANPTPVVSGASAAAFNSDASFQTTDIGSDGFQNKITFTHRNSTAANNASAGTNIVFANNLVFGYEQQLQNIGVDLAVTLNFNEYSDVAKTLLVGTGTAVVNGHVAGTLGNFGADIGATFSPSPVDFVSGGKTFRLSNFAFTPGSDEFAGAIGAFVQVVPEPTSLAAIGLASTALVRRRRA